MGTLRRGNGSLTCGVPFLFDDRNITSPQNRAVCHPDNPVPTLHQSPIPVAFQTRIARNGRGQPQEICDALTSSEGGSHADSKPLVAGSFGCRRLTPRECERLQGFPDDHTRWAADVTEISDSARYRMIGNSVAVPVVIWIGRRIAAAMEIHDG